LLSITFIFEGVGINQYVFKVAVQIRKAQDRGCRKKWLKMKNLLLNSCVVCLMILISAPTAAYGQSWLQLGNELSADESVFEVDVSASGGTIALGSPFNNNNVGNQGAVSIYDWTGNSWLQKGNTFTGDNANDNLGFQLL
jgi:hypothetical protein